MTTAGEVVVERRPLLGCDPEELRLIQVALAGQQHAFDILVQRHTAQVASVVRRFAADPNDCEDLVQETFVRAFQNLRGFRGEASVRTWFIRIAINVCRKRRLTFWSRRVMVGGESAQGRLQAAASRDPAAASDLRHMVAVAVAELPERLRLPLVLHVFEELTGAEIAAVLGCSQSTVWSRIYAAQRELRKKLASLEE